MTGTEIRAGQATGHPLDPATAAEYLAGREIMAAAGRLRRRGGARAAPHHAAADRDHPARGTVFYPERNVAAVAGRGRYAPRFHWTIHNGFGGRPCRYTCAATSEPGWFVFNGLVKHDTLTGRAERYQFEPGVFCSEVGVAPRVGGTEEDDAYLVTLTVDMNRDLSECVVFRADDVGWGPIARAQLPERIASGTHSCWAPGESIAGW